MIRLWPVALLLGVLAVALAAAAVYAQLNDTRTASGVINAASTAEPTGTPTPEPTPTPTPTPCPECPTPTPAPTPTPLATIGIDTGTSGNTATSLGSLETCSPVANQAGGQFGIDVFLDGIPSGQNLAGFQYQLNFDDTRFKITVQNHVLLLASQGTYGPFSFTEVVPDTTSPHDVAEIDFFGTPEAGPASGVLSRFTLEILPGAANGVTNFSLTQAVAANSAGGEIQDQVLDANIALGDTCPTPTPTPMPTPMPTPTPTPTPAPLACDGIPATIIGTDQSDILEGTPGTDVVLALDGNDLILALAGHDVICAGPGDDLVVAGRGDDRVWGEEGEDILLGGPGDDFMDGGGAFDFCMGATGSDVAADCEVAASTH